MVRKSPRNVSFNQIDNVSPMVVETSPLPPLDSDLMSYPNVIDVQKEVEKRALEESNEDFEEDMAMT